MLLLTGWSEGGFVRTVLLFGAWDAEEGAAVRAKLSGPGVGAPWEGGISESAPVTAGGAGWFPGSDAAAGSGATGGVAAESGRGAGVLVIWEAPSSAVPVFDCWALAALPTARSRAVIRRHADRDIHEA